LRAALEAERRKADKLEEEVRRLEACITERSIVCPGTPTPPITPAPTSATTAPTTTPAGGGGGSPSQCGTCRGCIFASHGKCEKTIRNITLDEQLCSLWAGNIWCGDGAASALATVHADGDLNVAGRDAASILATVHADGDLNVAGLDSERPRLMRTRGGTEGGAAASHERARLMRTRTAQTVSSGE
jgi:hypothetical protein